MEPAQKLWAPCTTTNPAQELLAPSKTTGSALKLWAPSRATGPYPQKSDKGRFPALRSGAGHEYGPTDLVRLRRTEPVGRVCTPSSLLRSLSRRNHPHHPQERSGRGNNSAQNLATARVDRRGIKSNQRCEALVRTTPHRPLLHGLKAKRDRFDLNRPGWWAATTTGARYCSDPTPIMRRPP